MDFSAALDTKMDDVSNGSTEPFIVYLDNSGSWHSDYTQNQYGNEFDWVEDAKKEDPLYLIYTGTNFARASYPSVYDSVLCDRICKEYELYLKNGNDDKALHALVSFITENISEFSNEVVDFLTTSFRPLTSLTVVNSLNLETYHRSYDYDSKLAKDAIDRIEYEVARRQGVDRFSNMSLLELIHEYAKHVSTTDENRQLIDDVYNYVKQRTEDKPREQEKRVMQKQSLLGNLEKGKKKVEQQKAERTETSPSNKRDAREVK